MSSKTKIEWADATWSPVRGCSRVSPGCKNCYAERMAARGLPGLNSPTTGEPFAIMTPNGPRWTGKVELIEKALEIPLRWRKPRRIFVNSMSDLFHDSLSFDEIRAVFNRMQSAFWHTYLVLTKRSSRLPSFQMWMVANDYRIPFSNVHLGVSVENRASLGRVEHLRATPAAVRFLSCEPLLEDLGKLDLRGIHQVIVGGESGPGARPMHPDWARSIRDQCVAAGVRFHFKQWGEWVPLGQSAMKGVKDGSIGPDRCRWIHPDGTVTGIGRGEAPGRLVVRVGKARAGRLLDGREWNEMPEAKA